MTIRELLIKKKRWYFVSAIVSLILGVISLQVWVLSGRAWLSYVGLALLGISALGVLGYRLLVRCPRCRGNIGWAHSHFGSKPFLFIRTMAKCPLCGVSLDASVGT